MYWKCGGSLALVITILCFHVYFTPGCVSTVVVKRKSENFSRVCDDLENIFRTKKTQITKTDLKQVKPTFPEVRSDRCIQTVERKPLEQLSPEEVNGFKHCIGKMYIPRSYLKSNLNI
jgi:hypothetical protein